MTSKPSPLVEIAQQLAQDKKPQILLVGAMPIDHATYYYLSDSNPLSPILYQRFSSIAPLTTVLTALPHFKDMQYNTVLYDSLGFYTNAESAKNNLLKNEKKIASSLDALDRDPTLYTDSYHYYTNYALEWVSSKHGIDFAPCGLHGLPLHRTDLSEWRGEKFSNTSRILNTEKNFLHTMQIESDSPLADPYYQLTHHLFLGREQVKKYRATLPKDVVMPPALDEMTQSFFQKEDYFINKSKRILDKSKKEIASTIAAIRAKNPDENILYVVDPSLLSEEDALSTILQEQYNLQSHNVLFVDPQIMSTAQEVAKKRNLGGKKYTLKDFCTIGQNLLGLNNAEAAFLRDDIEARPDIICDFRNIFSEEERHHFKTHFAIATELEDDDYFFDKVKKTIVQTLVP